ncbi:aspartyl/asparaginyl beta-hydroxylase domain-containing protein [Sphingomonas sp. RT2P30]|uniref:aspartyl/asparaginyl beta-hydroxylase domain-containing protein n=1 Tax=Parasphingomonas halimpatiens TaxID=3096162 RepID=UPI002FC9FB8C
MQLTTDEALNLVRRGAAALQKGRASEARQCLEAVTRAGRVNGQIWMLLAAACRADDDVLAEEQAINELLALEPGAVRGHIMKGDCRDKAGDEQGALRFYESALLIAEGQQIPDDLAPEIRRVEATLKTAYDRLDQRREASLTARGIVPGARSPRFQQSLDISAGRKKIFPQSPTSYYFPGLPQIQYFERESFDWVPAVEAAADAIRAELETVLAQGRADFRPYLEANPDRPRPADKGMLDNPDWSTLFLCENGRLNDEAIARCPKTWEAVQAAPLPRVANQPTVMFSMLRAGARIAPHCGMFNTRLICHLPLIVPPGCGFRVGNEVREWEPGKLLIFDDTIEHEAWNDSDRDRVVLIFDVWRPELTDQERREVGALFSGPDPT